MDILIFSGPRSGLQDAITQHYRTAQYIYFPLRSCALLPFIESHPLLLNPLSASIEILQAATIIQV